MSPVPPATFVRLAPFRAWFGGGAPALMYHKLGPRPRAVRLKGLYVGTRLFARQLAELRDGGFASCLPGELAGGKPGRVAITFDDGYVNVLRHGLQPLADTGFRAMQYIVAGALGGGNDWDAANGEAYERLMDAAQIHEWLAAGHAIGSHTLSHARLIEIPPAQAREEIAASRKRLEDVFGIPVKDFCYPYGNWNPRVRDLVIEAGYETACTTDFGINTAETSPFELKRIQARYASWSLRALQERLRPGPRVR
jgi:peptidoglycan/xylan/chitin deacetylase (PgdA/CDA1 family)